MDLLDMECDQVVPIEEPIEVVIVGQELTLESNSGVLSSNHDNHIPNPNGSQNENKQDKKQRTGNIVDRLTSLQKQMTTEVITEAGADIQKEIKEVTKRFRDKMKKRIRRKDVEFRKKESVKAKTRMADRRNDPNYREIERQKDRERRAAARLNSAVREREREKDRNYKKKCRDLYVNQVRTYNVGTHDTNTCNRKCAIAGSSGDCGKTGNMKHSGVTGKVENDGIHCTNIDAVRVLNNGSNSVVYTGSHTGCDISVADISVDQTVEIQESESSVVVLFSSADSVTNITEGINSELTSNLTSNSEELVDVDRTLIQTTSGYEVCVDNSDDKQEGSVGLEELDQVTVQDFTELLAEHVAQVKSQSPHDGLSVVLYSND